MNNSEHKQTKTNKSFFTNITIPDTDAFFYDNVAEPLSNYFSEIHPNWITLFGLPLSFIVYMTHWFPPLSFIISYVVMMIRTLCDLLDGHVARKYNKVTAFGALLDTLADAINAANFVIYFAIRSFDFSFAACSMLFAVIVGLIITITFKTGVLFDHSLLKRQSSNLIEFLFAIGKYNMVIQITLIYTIIWYFLI